MKGPVSIIVAILLALGAVEVLAYWWMHPAPAGLDQPVLCYRPEGRGPQGGNQKPQQGNSSASSDLLSDHPSFSITPLPEVVAKALPSLHCSTGTAARIERDEGVTVHVAFFEWDLSDSTNVLQAFKHLPEQCLGSIGMILIEQRPPRLYPLDGETLSFDHTVFRDQGGVIVHAFKGTWVSGASSLIGDGVRGGVAQWRQLRWKAALKRFRPAHARVAQGAVRGISDPDLAWQVFEESMLKDLRFEAP